MSGTSVSRIPSLDGIRAISIVMVLMLHLSDTKNFLRYQYVEPFNFGYFGVWTFFVISGFLITSLLLHEIDSTGTVSLKNFYIRRTMRIFPCSYVYLLILAGLGLLAAVDFWHALTYTVNYHKVGRGWLISHLWSLSVEEQFYLLWPAVLCYGGRRRGFAILLAVCAIAPVVRVGLWMFVPSYRPYIGETFETVFDSLATGCLLAMSREWLWEQRWYRAILQSRWMVVLPFVAAGCSALYIKPRIFMGVGQTIFNISGALCIDWAVRFPRTTIGTVLNWKPLAFVGTLSYSLYIWQQPFCVEFRNHGAWWATFPVNVILAFLAALASYYFVEKPFLALRRKLTESSRETAIRKVSAGMTVG